MFKKKNSNSEQPKDTNKKINIPKVKIPQIKMPKLKILSNIKMPSNVNLKPKKIKFNKKMLIIPIIIILLIIASFIFFKFFNPSNTTDNPSSVTTDISENEKFAEQLQSELSDGLKIGTTTKEEILAKGIVNEETSGDSYLIKKDYTTIDNMEFFTTYLIKDDILVGIVHEAILDTDTKYKLATTFQTVASDLNRAYPDINVSKRWFAEAVKYDSNVWNKMVVNNELELVAELAKDSEFVKLIASGVPYFNYLYNNRYDQSFGNLVIIYSNGANQDLFKQIDDISFNS